MQELNDTQGAGGRSSDPNLLVQWKKNGDHPEDNCEVFGDGPFKGRLKEGKVVRYFRHPGVDGDAVCPLCNQTYHDHGFLDLRTPDADENQAPPDPVDVSAPPAEPYGGPYYPGLVCPGDWILKTVITPGQERYTVKRPELVARACVQQPFAVTPTPTAEEQPQSWRARMKASMSAIFGG
jgi:hypothetical protein